MKALFLFVTICFYLFFPIKANLLYKCPDFYLNIPAETTTAPHKENHIDPQSLIIPSHLMSHFQPHEFRMESSNAPFCDINYDVININLIGLVDTEDISTSQSPTNILTNDYANLEHTSYETISNGNVTTTFPSSTTGNRDRFGNIDHIENNTEKEELLSANSSFYVDTDKQPRLCERVLSRRKVHFTPTGFLFYITEYYSPKEFCIQSFSLEEQWVAIRKCHINCDNENTPCIPLCCHLHEHVDLGILCCQEALGDLSMFQPVIYDNLNRKISLEEGTDSPFSSAEISEKKGIQPHYVTLEYNDNEACPDGHDGLLFFNEDGDSTLDTKIHIKSNGKLAYIGDDRKWHYLEKYCVAGFVNADEFYDYSEVMKNMTGIVRYCMEEESGQRENMIWSAYMYIAAFGICSVFLFLTVIVYILLWDKQNIHGWTILSFVLAEFFLFIFMSLTNAIGVFTVVDDGASKSLYCVGAAICAHFFFLSTFTWLTIVNLDLWWTFNNFTPISERSKGKKRFCFYMAFAWGVPIITVGIGLILQSLYKSNSSFVVVPDYGNRQCFLSAHAKGVYLYYIIGVLLLINFILISFTIITIYKFKKGARMATTSSSKTKERSFKLFAKLVVVMGVTWSLEFILWFLYKNSFSLLVLAVDLFNIFQAVATFIIFVCKKKILSQLEQKHPSLKIIVKPILRVLASRPGTHNAASTNSKQTRSTTMNSTGPSSSVLHRSRRKSHRVSVADCEL